MKEVCSISPKSNWKQHEFIMALHIEWISVDGWRTRFEVQWREESKIIARKGQDVLGVFVVGVLRERGTVRAI